MFLVGTVADASKKLQRWLGSTDPDGRLSDFRVATARSFMDWLGPMAAAQLQQPEELLEDEASDGEYGKDAASLSQAFAGTPQWSAKVVPASWLGVEAAAAAEAADERQDADLASRRSAIASLALLDDVPPDDELRACLDWRYPHEAAARLAAKTSVTEMKRLHAEKDAYAADWAEQTAWPTDRDAEDAIGQAKTNEGAASALGDAIPDDGKSPSSFTLRLRRPAFMEEKSLTAAERGSASHLLMQHVPLTGEVDEDTIAATLADMVARRLLTPMQAASIDAASVSLFFQSEIGKRMRSAGWIRREVPFSAMLPAERIYGREQDRPVGDERILIQGVIDCLFRDGDGLVLVDYKTDRIHMKQWELAAERHRFQLELYAEAISSVLGEPVAEKYVYFFDGAGTVRL
jgi:ATP-dependent helicase/nuclease subunit A